MGVGLREHWPNSTYFDRDAPKESADTSTLWPAAVFKFTCPQPPRDKAQSPLPGAPARGRGSFSAHCTPVTRLSAHRRSTHDWRQPPWPLPSLGKSLRFEGPGLGVGEELEGKPAGKLPSVKCRTSAGAARRSPWAVWRRGLRKGSNCEVTLPRPARA